MRQTFNWSRFTIDTQSKLKTLQGLLGDYIWVGSRKKRPKVDCAASTLSINDAWNVVIPRPDNLEENPKGVTYGNYDLLYDPCSRALKVWITYKKVSTAAEKRISDLYKTNGMPATATAFRSDWDTEVQVKKGTTFQYTDSNGTYCLRIVDADDSAVRCVVVLSKNNTHAPGVEITVNDTEKVRSIIKSKLQKTVNN